MESFDMRSAGVLLAEAEARTRRGKYYDALGILERTRDGVHGGHSEHCMGLICAAAARNKLHLEDEQGALQYLALISTDLRAANPKIDSECHTIAGILHRRNAHKQWKAGRKSDALALVGQAVEAFRRAEYSAQMALEDRLQHNAVLNRLYATGLHCAIQNQPRERYATLLAEAIQAEAASRDSTPPALRDELTGLIIVVDLACGGEIGYGEVASLSDDGAFRQSVSKIVRPDCDSWPELILSHVRQMHVCKDDVLARALLLGCKMLFRETAGRVDSALMVEYASRLRLHYMDMEGTSSNALLKQHIAGAFAQFPVELMRKVMHPRFLR